MFEVRLAFIGAADTRTSSDPTKQAVVLLGPLPFEEATGNLYARLDPEAFAEKRDKILHCRTFEADEFGFAVIDASDAIRKWLAEIAPVSSPPSLPGNLADEGRRGGRRSL
jgi:hypothetical protein